MSFNFSPKNEISTNLPSPPEEDFPLTQLDFAILTMEKLDGSRTSNLNVLVVSIQNFLVGSLSPDTIEVVNSLHKQAKMKRESYLDSLPDGIFTRESAQEELRNGNITIDWYYNHFPRKNSNPFGFIPSDEKQTIATSPVTQVVNTSNENTPITNEIDFAMNVLNGMDGSNINLMYSLIEQIISLKTAQLHPKTAEMQLMLQRLAKERRQLYLEQIMDCISPQYAVSQLLNGLVTIEWYNSHFSHEAEKKPIAFPTE